MVKAVLVLGVLFFLYLLAAPIIIKFIPTVVIKSPTISTTANRLLQDINLKDNCDTLHCSNIFFLYPSEELAISDLSFCKTDKVSTNVLFSKPLDRIGIIGVCEPKELFTCKKNSVMVKLLIYSLVPYPKKINDFYYCKE